MTRRKTATLVAGCLGALVALCASTGFVIGGIDGSQAVARSATPMAEPQLDPDPSDAARLVRREVRSLAEAWAIGGGRYGFPYWEKAWHRWRDREIGTSAFREYVTGYRDTLRPGCSLLEDLDIESESVRDIRSSLVEACRARLAALKSQQRRLELLIEKDPETQQIELVELDAEFEEHLQHSYELTRLAMNDSQAQLDALGLARIDEDAFL